MVLVYLFYKKLQLIKRVQNFFCKREKPGSTERYLDQLSAQLLRCRSGWTGGLKALYQGSDGCAIAL